MKSISKPASPARRSAAAALILSAVLAALLGNAALLVATARVPDQQAGQPVAGTTAMDYWLEVGKAAGAL
jgi:hypothetical protein